MEIPTRPTSFVGMFHELSESISAAATDPAEWPEFLEKLASAEGANSIGLHWESMDPLRRGSIALKHGLATTFTREYEQYYGPRNPIIAGAAGLIVPGRAVFRQEACSERRFLASEFYNDFLKPNDILHILGGTIDQRGKDICMSSICRPHDGPLFGRTEAQLLEALIPHMW